MLERSSFCPSTGKPYCKVKFKAPGLILAASGAETETETRLFGVFSSTYHTVLVFTSDTASSTDVLEALRGTPEMSFGYRGYLAVKGEKKVIVVGPDGVVGAIVHSAEGWGHTFLKISPSSR